MHVQYFTLFLHENVHGCIFEIYYANNALIFHLLNKYCVTGQSRATHCRLRIASGLKLRQRVDSLALVVVLDSILAAVTRGKFSYALHLLQLSWCEKKGTSHLLANLSLESNE